MQIRLAQRDLYGVQPVQDKCFDLEIFKHLERLWKHSRWACM